MGDPNSSRTVDWFIASARLRLAGRKFARDLLEDDGDATASPKSLSLEDYASADTQPRHNDHRRPNIEQS